MTAPDQRWRTPLAVATLVLAGAWAVLGWLLLTDYRPGDTPVLPYQAVGVVLAVVGGALVAIERRRLDIVPIAGLGVVAAVAAVLTLPQVTWDTIAMSSVTTGESVRGIWWPVANSEEVAFLVVAGERVEPDAYTAAVYAHVVAAAATLMTLPLATVLGRRPAPEHAVDELPDV